MARRRLLAWAIAPALLGLLLLVSRSGGESGEADDSSRSSPRVATTPVRRPAGLTPASPATPPTITAPASSVASQRKAERELWERRVARARRTLDAYLEATRYPPESRPIGEHPDQIRPSSPERTMPLDRTGEGEVQLRLRQEKVFVVGQEDVGLFVGCEDPKGGPRPCQLLSAVAHEAPHDQAARELASLPVAFVDDGRGGLTARFQPSSAGFPLYEGTLRIDLQIQSGTASGAAFFDLVYTPSPPAAFTGVVREALEDGSLNLYVGLQVRKSGRYVLTGRVDDVTGTPFALVTFNEELAEGSQEAKFTLFGKLVLDERPQPPFTLRDVEGFLLKESGDPDREVITSLLGPVHTTRTYAESAFSSAEWQSEERTRHVTEFTRDLEDAQRQLASLPP